MTAQSEPLVVEEGAGLPPDFADRLERSLDGADRSRRRKAVVGRAQRVLPVLLLVGPIVGWRLMLTSPDGAHVVIGALTRMAFVLDVGVHLDTVTLGYLGLQALPGVVGFLLLVLIAATLLTTSREAE